MQYYIINNDSALIMHYRALLQMPRLYQHIPGIGETKVIFQNKDLALLSSELYYIQT